ncbi:MAG: M56 family metallopeptidase [Armatimonadota bacterium]
MLHLIAMQSVFWFPWLLDMLVKSAVLLALVGVASLLCWRASAAQRHLLWTLALAGVLLLPVLSVVLPAWRVVRLPEWRVAAIHNPAPAALPRMTPVSTPAETAPVTSIAPASAESAETSSVPASPAAPAPAAPAAPIIPSLPWYLWVMFTWGVGSLLLLARWGYGYVVTKRILRQAQPAPGETLPARVMISEEIAMPVVVGIFRPAILLPAQAEEWPDERRRIVLLHEAAHIRRGDLLAHLLTQFACALYWMNPLVWLAAYRLRVERELACDDAVLATQVKASDYAAHLLAVAGALHGQRLAPVVGIAMARSSKVGKRIVAVLTTNSNRAITSPKFVITTGFILIGLMLGLSSVTLRAQEHPIPQTRPQTFLDIRIKLTFTPLTAQEEGFYRYHSPTPSISPDGRFIYFVTDTHWSRDGKPFAAQAVLRYRRDTGQLTDTGLLKATTGERFDRFGRPYHDAIFSADGRYAVYASKNPRRIVLESGSGYSHIYLKDQQTGNIIDITKTAKGTPPNGESGSPAISGDGTVVAFCSRATNLTPIRFKKPKQFYSTEPAQSGFYLYDIKTRKFEFVHVSGLTRSMNADPVADLRLDFSGNVVVFTGQFFTEKKVRNGRQLATWLESLAYNRKTKKISYIGTVDGGSHQYGIAPRVSADGRFAVFNNTAMKTNGYLYDLQHHSIAQINVTADGKRGGNIIGSPAISGDGQYVVYAIRLEKAAGKGVYAYADAKISSEIYLLDRKSGRTLSVSEGSVALRKELGLDYYDNLTPSINADGRYIAYAAHLAKSTLKYGDSNSSPRNTPTAWAILVYDRVTQKTSIVLLASGLPQSH